MDGEDIDNAEDAIKYMNNLIKRDTKPTNQEKNIKIRLYNKIERVKDKIPYYQAMLD